MEGNLNRFRVGTVPTVYYIPEFISEIEEKRLIEKVIEAPLSMWKSLKNRRLQNWGGIVHEKGLLPQILPPWLSTVTKRISEESGLFPSDLNHVLINEYLPNQGIMPHQDGPAYFPVVAIISLQSPVVMDFTPHTRHKVANSTESDKTSENFQVLIMPRSLLIFKDEVYSEYLHGIKDDQVHVCDKAINYNQAFGRGGSDEKSLPLQQTIHRTDTRISLTCRLVLKVHKNLFRF